MYADGRYIKSNGCVYFIQGGETKLSMKIRLKQRHRQQFSRERLPRGGQISFSCCVTQERSYTRAHAITHIQMHIRRLTNETLH